MSIEEIQKEHDDYLEMFSTDGWKHLITQMDELRTDILSNSISSAPTNDQWQFLRGQVSQLNSVIGFENYIEVSHAAALEEEYAGVSDLEQ